MESTPFTLEGKLFWTPDFPISVTRERERFTLPIHIHDFVEIQYVAEGKGFHYIGDERIYVEKGDLFIIPIGTRHVYRPSSEAPKDELIVYNCLFDPSVPEKLTQAYPLPENVLFLLSGGGQSYRRFKDSFNEAKICMETLYREYQTELPGYEAVLYARLTELLVFLCRLELSRKKTAPAISQLAKVFEYIERHSDRPLTLSEVAALLHVSVSYLQRMLKQATGQSFTEYVQNLRIRKCCEMLRQTPLPVKEIAAKAGYRDLKFFHELFRKKTGLTPRAYRSCSQ
ncbi:AraC family transcriptional regulator [Cohnella herbarum]|uniref:AraC family transcriptional regulator n=1 Tax=Cohnella herbarum TaxID=2728023 RepID=A0A7Z2VJU4_9BACL|nr:AraC family transcriptional regulator [Cohnella herbarum]QJD84280.1 AraC family transcriptional regulator [Cohnella herbarum]